MPMRSSLLAVFTLIGTAAVAAGQTSAPQPQPAGALQPQQTSPLPGATPPTPGAPPAPVPANVVAPPPAGRVFAAEQGIIFNAIRPDKVADFETVIAQLRKALETSKDPVRNQQGWSWKIFKAVETGPNGSVLYVFVMDPAVKGADYGVAKILAEAYPTEIMELYRMYSGAFAAAGQTLLNLGPVPSPGSTTTPPLPGAPTTTTPPAAGTSAPAPATAPR
jgi:hypothetical protein